VRAGGVSGAVEIGFHQLGPGPSVIARRYEGESRQLARLVMNNEIEAMMQERAQKYL
jgi:hypothetical protein